MPPESKVVQVTLVDHLGKVVGSETHRYPANQEIRSMTLPIVVGHRTVQVKIDLDAEA